jgi:hypothetical protein
MSRSLGASQESSITGPFSRDLPALSKAIAKSWRVTRLNARISDKAVDPISALVNGGNSRREGALDARYFVAVCCLALCSLNSV